MTQSNTQSVRNKAESAVKSPRIPTFEEVYAMPYVQESIDYILNTNLRKYPMLASYADDIRQDILIALNAALPKYDGRAGLNTFCRICIENTSKNIVRNLLSDEYFRLINAEDISMFEDTEENIDRIDPDDLRAFVSQCRNNVEEEYNRMDFDETIERLPEPSRTIAIELMNGKPILEIEKITGIPDSTIVRNHIYPIRRALRKLMR